MKNILKHTLGVVDDFAAGQLKAFYVGHADTYISKLGQSLETTVIEAAAIAFPEWVPALCALFAATSCIVKIAIKAGRYLFGNK